MNGSLSCSLGSAPAQLWLILYLRIIITTVVRDETTTRDYYQTRQAQYKKPDPC